MSLDFSHCKEQRLQLSRVYHRLQRSGSCTSKDVGIGANPKSVTICGFLLGGKTTLLVPTTN
nr:MAG TPA: hypothetical protein [Caudoviricetes sp.]DAX00054.1 MAG TPA: hypothetical protein [Bacteriophage sp.]